MMYCVKTSSSFTSPFVADVVIVLKVLVVFGEYLIKLVNEAGFDDLRVKVCPREKTTDDDEKKRLATTPTVGFESITVVF
jgi:hypothetical protein